VTRAQTITWKFGGILDDDVRPSHKIECRSRRGSATTFRGKRLKTVIPETVRLSEAPSFGKSILEYNRAGQAHMLRALAQEFLKRHANLAG